MSATAAMRDKLRRMVNEPDSSNGYDDETLDEYIETYPLIDDRGQAPYTYDTSTSPPTQDANDDWIDTYDLHAAAALIWAEKAGSWADKYAFTADGGQYQRHQAYEQMMKSARYHAARRAPRTIRAYMWPEPTTAAIQNLLDDARANATANVIGRNS